jgi:hypothetical protein
MSGVRILIIDNFCGVQFTICFWRECFFTHVKLYSECHLSLKLLKEFFTRSFILMFQERVFYFVFSHHNGTKKSIVMNSERYLLSMGSQESHQYFKIGWNLVTAKTDRFVKEPMQYTVRWGITILAKTCTHETLFNSIEHLLCTIAGSTMCVE